MPREFPLDMIIVQGETYYTDKREYFVIKKIGTDASTDTHLKVDNKELGDLISTVAPLHSTSSNTLGPVNLGQFYIVIPPETEFVVEGASGAKMRLVGIYGKIAPGEPLPGDLEARFNNQHNAYITHLNGSVSLGTDVSFSADAEQEIMSLTPKTIEKYILAFPVMGSVDNYTASEGDLAYRFYVDNEPLDLLTSSSGDVRGGIDLLSMPRPPAATTEQVPFSFADMPLEILGDHTLSIRVRNTKGSAISPSAGTSLTFYVDTLAVYIRTG